MPDRSALLAAKLRVLADAPDAEPADFPGGAALVDGSRAWVLLDADPARPRSGRPSCGPSRRGVSDVTLVVDDADAGGRRPAGRPVRRPARPCSRVDGTSTVPAEPAPTPCTTDAPSAPALAELLVDADLEVVVEDGIVRGEVLGLEVARIVHGTHDLGHADRRAGARGRRRPRRPRDDGARARAACRRWTSSPACATSCASTAGPAPSATRSTSSRPSAGSAPRLVARRRTASAWPSSARRRPRCPDPTSAIRPSPSPSARRCGRRRGGRRLLGRRRPRPRPRRRRRPRRAGARTPASSSRSPSATPTPSPEALAARLLSPAELVPVDGDWRV